MLAESNSTHQRGSSQKRCLALYRVVHAREGACRVGRSQTRGTQLTVEAYSRVVGMTSVVRVQPMITAAMSVMGGGAVPWLKAPVSTHHRACLRKPTAAQCRVLTLQGVINLAPSSASAQLATLWNASRAMPPISRHPSPMAHSAVQVPKTRCFLGTFKHPFARVQVHRTMFSARLQEERSSTSKLHLADRYCPAPMQVAATHHRQALS